MCCSHTLCVSTKNQNPGGKNRQSIFNAASTPQSCQQRHYSTFVDFGTGRHQHGWVHHTQHVVSQNIGGQEWGRVNGHYHEGGRLDKSGHAQKLLPQNDHQTRWEEPYQFWTGCEGQLPQQTLRKKLFFIQIWCQRAYGCLSLLMVTQNYPSQSLLLSNLMCRIVKGYSLWVRIKTN